MNPDLLDEIEADPDGDLARSSVLTLCLELRDAWARAGKAEKDLAAAILRVEGLEREAGRRP